MLVCCKECGGNLSTNALACPHCGNPNVEKGGTKQRLPRRRHRLPNGFGQITKIKGKNLTRPYRAMVTVGKNELGRPICKLLKPTAYFKTYNEAYSALLEYSKNPIDLRCKISVKELHDQWAKEYYKFVSSGTKYVYDAAWKYCHSCYDKNISDINSKDIKACMYDSFVTLKGGDIRKPSPKTQENIKIVWSLMLDFAVDKDMIDRNYAREFRQAKTISKEIASSKKSHICFTKEEMNILWNDSKDDWAKMVLIQCYSGWRPRELCNLKISDVDINNWTFVGGNKTNAGKNRLVPIHPKIRGFVKYYYDKSSSVESGRLFTTPNGGDVLYNYYLNSFHNLMTRLNLNSDHKPHDPRKQFITMAKEAGVDEYAIKYLVGHSITDITEKVYTEREKTWLSTEISKIK